MKNVEFEKQRPVEREPHVPLIHAEEKRFIEDTGGAYSGYIRSSAGQRKYEQFRIHRRARYDEDRRAVIETYIATETVDQAGEKEMQGPEDAFGFSVLIGDLSQSGEDLGRPEIFTVRPTDFRGKGMTTADILDLARKTHGMASDGASSLSRSELSAMLKNYLRSMGWDESR